jgi:hypothetical protein
MCKCEVAVLVIRLHHNIKIHLNEAGVIPSVKPVPLHSLHDRSCTKLSPAKKTEFWLW